MSEGRWWQRRWAIALAMVAATLPLWFVRVPPLIDLLGHMGRYEVQLHLADSSALRASWAFHWQLIGNLGCDLLMEVLGRLFGVERGAVVLAAALPPLMIWGQARLARAVHGQVPATAWAAFAFAMAYPWHYGMMNYWLGIALALHSAAWAIAAGRSRHRTLVLIPLCLALWTAHIFGWAVFSVLLWSDAMTKRGWRRVAPETLKLWPLAAPAILMLALRYGSAGAAAETLGWADFAYKAQALLWTLRDQWQWLDVGSLIAALLLILAATQSKAFEIDKGLGVAALVLVSALLVLPYQILGSAFADTRLWPVVFIVALLAIRPATGTGPLLAANLALGAALVFGVRVAVTTSGFVRYDRDYARHLRALNMVPRGSKMAVFVKFPCHVPWRRPRLDHIDGLAIVRRDAFTNGQWDVPGAQSLTPLDARGTQFNSDPSQLIRSRDCHVDLQLTLASQIAAFPRDRFDMVWVIGFAPATLPRWPGLTPVFADDETILYRIDR